MSKGCLLLFIVVLLLGSWWAIALSFDGQSYEDKGEQKTVQIFRTWTPDVALCMWWWVSLTLGQQLFWLWAWYSIARPLGHLRLRQPRSFWERLLRLRPLIYILVLVAVYGVEHIFQIIIATPYLDNVSVFFTFVKWMISLAAWFNVLDTVQSLVEDIARESDLEEAEQAPITKWQAIKDGFVAFGQEEKDRAYGAKPKSIATVLVEVCLFYNLIGKVFAVCLFFLHSVGVSLYENIVPIGCGSIMTILLASVNVKNIINNLGPLALSNAFYVGDIISLSQPGRAPGDTPLNFLTGFVEAINWGYIVLRDFKKKQTFVPHAEFAQLVIHNWTRRPAKLCYWLLRVSSQSQEAAPRLAKLANFLRRWIAEHEDVDQKGYQKAVIRTDISNGLSLEVVFYPRVGANVYCLRAEFVVSLMDAATRLALSLVPTNLVTPFPEHLHQSGADAAAAAAPSAPVPEDTLDDLLPASRPDLRRRAGYAS